MKPRDEFIATLAHELRGPLAPLRNGIDLALSREPDDPLIVSALGVANRQVSRLTRLVDDLLDIGRVASGNLEIRLDTIALEDVLKRSIEATRLLIDERHHRLLSELPSASVQVRGDRDRLVQVFTNLLTNAAKYTPDGGHIAVICTYEDQHVAIHVQDTGIGIASDQLEHVFELFARVRDSQQMPVDGLGVGLSLSKHLVDQHGGTITATSKGPMRGSCFIVRLPLHGAIDVRNAELVPAAAHAPKRVLIVDDHADSAEMLAMLIQAVGHEAAVANDGGTALQMAEACRPDLILLDLGLPDLSGLEVARLLRRRPGGDLLRIVALTGWGQPADRERTREAGFNLHLVKPLSRESLDMLIGTLHEEVAIGAPHAT